MALTFVHTADWQIGRPYGRFAEDVAVRLRAQRIDCIDRIAEVAARHDAAHVLAAGDILDSEFADETVLRQMLGRLAVYPAITWHLLAGNHDPARPGGVWDRVQRLNPSDNVVLHVKPGVSALAPGAALLTAPLAVKEMRSDPTAWMDQAETAPGIIRIAMAHGSVQGFGSLGEAAVPLDAGRRTSARLDYLALGDWHGTKEVASGVWYSGTPEVDSFGDNDPGHVLVVRIAGRGGAPVVQRVETTHYRWLDRRVVVGRLEDVTPVLEALAALGPRQSRHVVRLRLEGVLNASEAAALGPRLAPLASSLLALDVDQRRLRVVVGNSDVSALDDAVLASVGERLRVRIEGNTREDGTAGCDARVATRALRILLTLSSGLAQDTAAP